MITIVMAEDHQVLIDGIISFFQYNDDVKIIGTANNGKDLIELVELKLPKLVITDIRMPKLSGIEATKIIKKKHPQVNVLAMTMFDQPEAIKEMIDAGATGYILKNSGIKMLSQAIKEVANGKTFFDPNVAYNFINSHINDKVVGKKEESEVILSRREKEILKLIGQGKTSREISEKLFISKYTVDTHRKNITRKLNLKGFNELVKYAVDSKYKF